MNTPSRRKASADYHAKLKAEGHRKVTLFLSPEALAALDTLAVGETSKAQAVNAALISAAREQTLAKAGAQAIRERLVVDVAEESGVSRRPSPSSKAPSAPKPSKKADTPKDNAAPMGRLKGHWKAP